MKEAIHHYYIEQDLNCAESILHVLNDRYSLELSEADFRLVSGFGGGCGCGKLCGALAGCVSALGCRMVTDRAHNTPGFREACGALCADFETALGSTECSSLRPKYFQDGVRCTAVLEAAAECFRKVTEEN